MNMSRLSIKDELNHALWATPILGRDGAQSTGKIVKIESLEADLLKIPFPGFYDKWRRSLTSEERATALAWYAAQPNLPRRKNASVRLLRNLRAYWAARLAEGYPRVVERALHAYWWEHHSLLGVMGRLFSAPTVPDVFSWTHDG